MPNKPKINSGPAKGYPISPAVESDWPELANQFARLQNTGEIDTSRVSKVRPMNRFEKFISPKGTAATALPWGTIAINRDMASTPDAVADNLVHEITHSNQESGLFSTMGKALKAAIFGDLPYAQRPREIEARQAELNRHKSQDIALKPERKSKVNAAPSFNHPLFKNDRPMR